MDAYHPRLRLDRDIFVFDLDNTLYPASSALFPQVEKRIGQYVQKHLGLAEGEAKTYQKELFMTYGTTLNGLMARHEADPQHYLDFVHDIDFSPIERDDTLRDALIALDGRRIIYTNADATYSAKVLERLGIQDLFEDVFDIHAGGLMPKPEDKPFDKFLSDHDVDPNRAIMFEDMVRNLIPAHKRGMGAVWINTGSPWGAADHDPEAVHAEAETLTDWLTRYVEARNSAVV